MNVMSKVAEEVLNDIKLHPKAGEANQAPVSSAVTPSMQPIIFNRRQKYPLLTPPPPSQLASPSHVLSFVPPKADMYSKRRSH